MTEYVEGKWKQFNFRMVDPKTDIPRVLEHLQKNLYTASLEVLGYVEETFPDWDKLFTEMMNDGNNLSFMAEDEDGNIAGMRMIAVHKKSDSDEIPDLKHPHSRDIWNFFISIDNKCKIFETYPDVMEYADLFGIAVDPKHRRQGLANEIYRRSLLFLKAKGFKLAKCSFTSPYSRKAAIKNGFKELGRSIVYSEAKKADGSPLNPDIDPDFYLDCGVFELDKVVL